MIYFRVFFYISFYFGKFECDGMLAFLTHTSQVFSWLFCTALYHFNSLLLTFITGFCSGIPCSSISHFVETSYLTFIPFNWLVATWCKIWVWGFSKQITNSFTCVYMCVYICAYMYVCVYMCMCVSVDVYVCMCVCVYVCISKHLVFWALWWHQLFSTR